MTAGHEYDLSFSIPFFLYSTSATLLPTTEVERLTSTNPHAVLPRRSWIDGRQSKNAILRKKGVGNKVDDVFCLDCTCAVMPIGTKNK